MRKAFTFTEIMLSLAIIGFITVMVLPIFFNTYGKKVSAAQLKKACTQITTATKHIMVDDRSRDMSSLNSDINANVTEDDDGNVVTLGFYYSRAGVKTSNAEQGAEYFLENYFKHTKSNCGSGGTGECVAPLYHSDNGTDVGGIPADFYCIRTTNDSTICMRYSETHSFTEVLIDVNGADRPNVTGSDVFVMRIDNDGQLLDLDDNGDHCNVESGINDETIIKYAAGCFYGIISRSWNMRDE
jgi:type II secretory pathway pseudopilin PulG